MYSSKVQVVVAVLVYLFCTFLYIPTTNSESAIRRVAIIGAGPAGLSLAAFLQRMTSLRDITVFESRSDALQTSLGGGLQLSSGAAVLNKIGIDLESVAEKIVSIRARDRYENPIFSVNVQSIVDGGAVPPCYSITRDALQKLLHSSIESPQNLIKTNKRLLRYDSSRGQGKLIFEDGTEESGFDLVFGADGIRSILNEYVNGQVSITKPSGLRITYGITDADINLDVRPSNARGEFRQWFGDSCYCLVASYGGIHKAIQHMIAVVYRDTERQTSDNTENWSSSKIGSVVENRIQKGGLMNVQEISDVLKACNASRFIDLSVRAVSTSSINPFFHWHKDRVVLLGDSAHAMAPFLGQGANQAIQDAYRIALAVNKINNNKNYSPLEQEKVIFEEMRRYENDRRIKTLFLGSKSGILGSLETIGTPAGMFARDTLFRILGKLGVVNYVFSDGATPDNYILD